MEEKKLPSKKVKCLMIGETKDVLAYGSTDIGGSKCCILTLQFSDDAFKKCEEFRFLNDFVLHFYMCDTFDSEIITGVNRYDTCTISEYNDIKKIVKIKAYNKKFYNNSELKLLRKDKIGNLLFGEEGN